MACDFCGGAEHSTHHHENRRDFRFGLSQTESKVCFDFFVSSFSLRSFLFLIFRKVPLFNFLSSPLSSPLAKLEAQLIF